MEKRAYLCGNLPCHWELAPTPIRCMWHVTQVTLGNVSLLGYVHTMYLSFVAEICVSLYRTDFLKSTPRKNNKSLIGIVVVSHWMGRICFQIHGIKLQICGRNTRVGSGFSSKSTKHFSDGKIRCVNIALKAKRPQQASTCNPVMWPQKPSHWIIGYRPAARVRVWFHCVACRAVEATPRRKTSLICRQSHATIGAHLGGVASAARHAAPWNHTLRQWFPNFQSEASLQSP